MKISRPTIPTNGFPVRSTPTITFTSAIEYPLPISQSPDKIMNICPSDAKINGKVEFNFIRNPIYDIILGLFATLAANISNIVSNGSAIREVKRRPIREFFFSVFSRFSTFLNEAFIMFDTVMSSPLSSSVIAPSCIIYARSQISISASSVEYKITAFPMRFTSSRSA